MSISTFSEIGGIFALLAFVHFFVDWIFQSHETAMAKSHNKLKLMTHCFVYTLGFIPVFLILKLPLLEILWLSVFLFLTHYIEDTYIPIMLWAKYIRKPPEFTNTNLTNDKDKFIAWVTNPTNSLGKILMIAIDQIIHLGCLVVASVVLVLK